MKRILIVWLFGLLTVKSLAQQTLQGKVDQLLRKMTLEEKLGQMYQCLGRGKLSVGEVQKKQDLDQLIRKGDVGSILVPGEAGDVLEMQRIAVTQTRLKIPLFFNMDVIHGYQTIFPIPLAMSGSFDPALVQSAHRLAALEASYDGINYNHGPMADLPRDPRWGRVMESNGEDPFLDAQMTRAAVNGFQDFDIRKPGSIMATAKHFIGYGASEGGKDYNIVDISEATLHNLHLPAFRAAINAGAGSVMTAFNTIDNIPAVANQNLLRGILRKELKFEGIVISDFGTITELVHHGYAKDGADAARLAIAAGIDIEMQSVNYKTYLPALIKRGVVPLKLVDEAVRRILLAKYRMGLFDDPYRLTGKATETLRSQAKALARKVAGQSIVLLKNDSIGTRRLLPITGVKKLAVIGPFSNSHAMLGRWSAKGDTADAVSLGEGLRRRYGKEIAITTAAGCDFEKNDTAGFQNAVNAALQNDLIVLALGEPETMSGEAASRTSIQLPEIQQRLAARVIALGKPLVLVLFNGRPLDLSWFEVRVPAILEAYYPGTEGGDALADILSGDLSPSAKLTMSFPRNVGQIPIYYNHLRTGKSYDANARYALKYIDLPDGPLYSFGYGLTYTTFKYGAPIIHSTHPNSWTVTVGLTNTGERKASETVQLYIQAKSGSNARPVIELKAFKKIELQPGQKTKVTFQLTAEQFRYWSSAYHKEVIEKGSYSISTGSDSQHLQFADLTIK